MQFMNAIPGQTVTVVLQTLDGYGSRGDGYQTPQVEFIQLPSGAMASGYPLDMTRVATGVYKHSFTLSKGVSSLGSYIVSVVWPDIVTFYWDAPYLQYELYLVNVSPAFGNSSVVPL